MKKITLLDNYLSYLKTQTNKSQETINAYNYDVKAYLVDSGDKYYKPENIIIYFSCLKEKGYKTASIKRKYVSLARFFDYLVDNKHLRYNPAKTIKLTLKKEKRLPRTISIRNVKRILKYFVSCANNKPSFSSIRNLAIIDLLITTGIRIGEASNIEMHDIDLTDRTILIHGKGKKERMVYVSSTECWRHIMDYINMRAKIKGNIKHLFLNKKQEKFGTHSIDAIFRKAIMKLHLDKSITPHCLRHTFATNLLINGGDIRTVQELLGHASISTTEIYTQVDTKRKKQVLNKYNYRNKLIDRELK